MYKGYITYTVIMNFTREQALETAAIGSGIGLVVAGTYACATAVRYYDKSKRFWWLDPQLLGCSVFTVGFAAATVSLAAKVIAKRN